MRALCDQERHDRRHCRVEAECRDCGTEFLVEVLAGSFLPDGEERCPRCDSEDWELTE